MNSKQIFAILVACTPTITWAGSPCSVDQGYPEVSDLGVVDQGIVIQLGSYFDDVKKPGEKSIQLVLTNEGWQRLDEPINMPLAVRNADCPIKPELPTEEELASWYWSGTPKAPDEYFEQELVGCIQFGDETWSGTSWYGGEGSWGIGSLVSFDVSKQETISRYLWGLQEYSVSHLELFDEQLWIGTTYHGECGGPEPGFGIKRYPLVSGKPFPYEVVNPKRTIPMRGNQAWDETRICGFAVRDMLVIDGDLWVATELGLSIVQVKEGNLEIQNYVPDLTIDSLMRMTSCDDLYAELLRSPRSITDKGLNVGIMFDEFWTKLSEQRPAFVKRHLLSLHGHDLTVEPTE